VGYGASTLQPRTYRFWPVRAHELPLGRGVGDVCVELGAHCRTLFPSFLDSVGTAVDSVTVFSWSNRIESEHLPARDERIEVNLSDEQRGTQRGAVSQTSRLTSTLPVLKGLTEWLRRDSEGSYLPSTERPSCFLARGEGETPTHVVKLLPSAASRLKTACRARAV
jgi:hypothetical protein